jgi:glycosyltransferase involved in cell wall biosynthesis
MPTRVYCLDSAGEWASRLESRGVPVHVIGRRPGRDWRVATRLRRLAREHRTTVLHCHQYTPFVYGTLSALSWRGPRVVFTEHGRLSDAAPSARRRAANRVLAPFSAAITAVSSELRCFMIAEGFPARRVSVVHNGIDPGAAPGTETRAAARAQLGLSAGQFAMVTAARLDPVKNLRMALDAVAALAQSDRYVSLVVIGDGPERERLQAHAKQSGIQSQVRWLGYRSDVRALLPAFDAYLNTSTSEGISVTILEAMAACLPVIATSVGGTPEVVVPEETGILVPSNDTVACAAAVDRLSRTPSLSARFGAAGRLRLESRFTVDRMTEQYLALYAG